MNVKSKSPMWPDEMFPVWPPRNGICPDCKASTYFGGESYGRFLYICETKGCKRCQRGFWQDSDALIYARHPSLWAMLDKFCPGRDFPDVLTPIMFLCENSSMLHVIGRCGACSKLFSGLYCSEATAGFTFETTEDIDCQKYRNDPSFHTSLTCDSCNKRDKEGR